MPGTEKPLAVNFLKRNLQAQNKRVEISGNPDIKRRKGKPEGSALAVSSKEELTLAEDEVSCSPHDNLTSFNGNESSFIAEPVSGAGQNTNLPHFKALNNISSVDRSEVISMIEKDNNSTAGTASKERENVVLSPKAQLLLEVAKAQLEELEQMIVSVYISSFALADSEKKGVESYVVQFERYVQAILCKQSFLCGTPSSEEIAFIKLLFKKSDLFSKAKDGSTLIAEINQSLAKLPSSVLAAVALDYSMGEKNTEALVKGVYALYLIGYIMSGNGEIIRREDLLKPIITYAKENGVTL